MLAEAGDPDRGAADVVVMTAAVADFRPETVAATKLKKGSAAEPSSVPLARNPDVLAELVTKRTAGQLVVGFAAGTGDGEADVLGADGSAAETPRGSKDAGAAAIWSAVAPRAARPTDG